MPWNEAETGSGGQGRELKIGCYDDDGFFECTPGMRRAVREAAEALRARGHTVEEWRPDGVKEAFALNGTFRNADGGRTFLELLKGKYSSKNIFGQTIRPQKYLLPYNKLWLQKQQYLIRMKLFPSVNRQPGGPGHPGAGPQDLHPPRVAEEPAGSPGVSLVAPAGQACRERKAADRVSPTVGGVGEEAETDGRGMTFQIRNLANIEGDYALYCF